VVDLNLENGLSPEQQAIEEAKKGILAIEGIYHAVNSTTFKLNFHDALVNGLTYLGKLHEKLLAQIGPEEVQKLRQQFAQPPTTPPNVA
jgi:hypothetical protein